MGSEGKKNRRDNDFYSKEMNEDYKTFLKTKTQLGGNHGFEPIWLHDELFDFQKDLTTWALRKGRAAIFADCGLGKTIIQLVWAENVVRKTNGRVLIFTPLAVAGQTAREAEKFGIDAYVCRDGKLKAGSGIAIANYERLHYFSPTDFEGVVCDESSILKHFTGATQKQVTRFMSKLPYRLLCTATAAPNDYIELGTSAEALGVMTHSDMLTRFFKQLDDKGQKKEQKKLGENQKLANHFARLSFRVHQSIGQWRLKHHAEKEFWRWVCSWARACRKPSDLGFDDTDFLLPELIHNNHVIKPATPPEGMLFTLPAFGLAAERAERRRTLNQRCEYVASLVNHNAPAVVWCHMNDEGNLLEKIIPGARQIAGATPDDDKEEIYKAFAEKELRVLVIKPKIGAWGLNWQHCSHVVTFASHSYEQFYQSVRRCWRFGQKSNVRLDVIATEGESRVIENMLRKAVLADVMFSELVKYMTMPKEIKINRNDTNQIEVPQWA